jgi:hypothetical protein
LTENIFAGLSFPSAPSHPVIVRKDQHSSIAEDDDMTTNESAPLLNSAVMPSKTEPPLYDEIFESQTRPPSSAFKTSTATETKPKSFSSLYVTEGEPIQSSYPSLPSVTNAPRMEPRVQNATQESSSLLHNDIHAQQISLPREQVSHGQQVPLQVTAQPQIQTQALVDELLTENSRLSLENESLKEIVAVRLPPS